MEKKKYEVRVAYVVYDYFNVVAESEDEAKDMAKEIADTHSLNDFQLQDTTCTIESAEPYDGEDEDDESDDDVEDYPTLYDDISDVCNRINQYCGYKKMTGEETDAVTLKLMDKMQDLSSQLKEVAKELLDHKAWDK